jgi:hypothetical protein
VGLWLPHTRILRPNLNFAKADFIVFYKMTQAKIPYNGRTILRTMARENNADIANGQSGQLFEHGVHIVYGVV